MWRLFHFPRALTFPPPSPAPLVNPSPAFPLLHGGPSSSFTLPLMQMTGTGAALITPGITPPLVPLLLITVSLLHYLCQRNDTESGPVCRKTSNLSSAAMRNTQISRKLMCNCGFIFASERRLTHVGLIISRPHAGLFRSRSLHPLSLKHCFPNKRD